MRLMLAHLGFPFHLPWSCAHLINPTAVPRTSQSQHAFIYRAFAPESPLLCYKRFTEQKQRGTQTINFS